MRWTTAPTEPGHYYATEKWQNTDIPRLYCVIRTMWYEQGEEVTALHVREIGNCNEIVYSQAAFPGWLWCGPLPKPPRLSGPLEANK